MGRRFQHRGDRNRSLLLVNTRWFYQGAKGQPLSVWPFSSRLRLQPRPLTTDTSSSVVFAHISVKKTPCRLCFATCRTRQTRRGVGRVPLGDSSVGRVRRDHLFSYKPCSNAAGSFVPLRVQKRAEGLTKGGQKSSDVTCFADRSGDMLHC